MLRLLLVTPVRLAISFSKHLDILVDFFEYFLSVLSLISLSPTVSIYLKPVINLDPTAFPEHAKLSIGECRICILFQDPPKLGFRLLEDPILWKALSQWNLELHIPNLHRLWGAPYIVDAIYILHRALEQILKLPSFGLTNLIEQSNSSDHTVMKLPLLVRSSFSDFVSISCCEMVCKKSKIRNPSIQPPSQARSRCPLIRITEISAVSKQVALTFRQQRTWLGVWREHVTLFRSHVLITVTLYSIVYREMASTEADRSRETTTIQVDRSLHVRLKCMKPYDSMSFNELIGVMADEFEAEATSEDR